MSHTMLVLLLYGAVGAIGLLIDLVAIFALVHAPRPQSKSETSHTHRLGDDEVRCMAD